MRPLCSIADYKFPFKLKLRLDWSELDLFGHINNVSYFKYLQASRLNYWEGLGLTDWHRDEGIGPLLASTHCEFRKPLHYPGNILVRVSVAEIRTTSFSLYHQILADDGSLAAEGHDVVVLFDYRKGAKYPLPTSLRDQIIGLESAALNAAR